MSQSNLDVVFNITVELIRGAVAVKVDSKSHISLSITVRFQRPATGCAALDLVVLDNGEGIKLSSLGSSPVQTRGPELRHSFRTYRVQSLVMLSVSSSETTQAAFCFDHTLGGKKTYLAKHVNSRSGINLPLHFETQT